MGDTPNLLVWIRLLLLRDALAGATRLFPLDVHSCLALLDHSLQHAGLRGALISGDLSRGSLFDRLTERHFYFRSSLQALCVTI